MKDEQIKEPLWSANFIYSCIANFLLFFSFYLLLPTLPFYLTEHFQCSSALVGIILSCYTIAALMIRPFSGYLVDMIARKPLYIIAQFIFTAVFIGYPLATTITMFVLMRTLHGLAFGTSSVSGSTLVIDILPSSRRGEGLGYYGLSNNLAMAIGPMIGLFIHDSAPSFNIIFTMALCCSTGAIVATSLIKAPKKPQIVHEPISLDRFVLLKGIPAGISLLLLSIPYGMTTSYVAMYGKEFGITSSGLFFSLMAIGLMVSRLISGRLVDKGYTTQVITFGIVIAILVFGALGMAVHIAPYHLSLAFFIYYAVAFILGFGFGSMFPAYNTLFVNLAPNNKRGTASSTYLTSWDLGIGCGLMIGGQISEITGSYSQAYLLGSVLSLVALCYFVGRVTPHFHRNKLR